jgi:hypothetical protein
LTFALINELLPEPGLCIKLPSYFVESQYQSRGTKTLVIINKVSSTMLRMMLAVLNSKHPKQELLLAWLGYIVMACFTVMAVFIIDQFGFFDRSYPYSWIYHNIGLCVMHTSTILAGTLLLRSSTLFRPLRFRVIMLIIQMGLLFMSYVGLTLWFATSTQLDSL